MEFFDSIQGRKSIRRFKQTLVPDEDIKKILDAGRRAPSANNTQPWSFIVVKNHTVLKQMADAARQMIDRMIPYAESEKQAQRLAAYKGNYYTFFENAPVVIAVLMEGYDAGTDRVLAKMGYSPEDIKRLRPLPGLQSVAAAIENMLLAIHALGYGSCWMTGPLVAQEAFEKLLGFNKERAIAALLPVGVPDENPPDRPRKPLEDIMRIIW
ncbi:MAG TPA: nitroreductase family protein [Nitrospirota bacterium]|nr:nitroreductase family protein [Nitrospirota bacterium]